VKRNGWLGIMNGAFGVVFILSFFKDEKRNKKIFSCPRHLLRTIHSHAFMRLPAADGRTSGPSFINAADRYVNLMIFCFIIY